MITIHFHKTVQQFTHLKQHQFEVNDLSSLYSGLVVLFPDLYGYMQTLINYNLSETLVFITKDRKILDMKWFLRDEFPEGTEELWLVPTIFGSGKFGKLGIGLALVAIAAVLLAVPTGGGSVAAAGGAAAGATGVGVAGSLASQSLLIALAAKVTLGIGLNLILSTLLEFFTPKIDSDKNNDRRNNDSFDALVNTTVNGTIVALNYGLLRIGGQIISAQVSTIDHDENTVIDVNNQFFGGIA